MCVAWFRLEDFGALIRARRIDDSVTHTFARFLRSELVAIDDIGLLPVASTSGRKGIALVSAPFNQEFLSTFFRAESHYLAEAE